MKPLTNQEYREILSYVPGTCMIVFDTDLTILEVIDSDGILPELISDSRDLGNIREISDPVWQKSLTFMCENALRGSPPSRTMDLILSLIHISEPTRPY